MSKMTIMIGLPASGKSTAAEATMIAHGNTIRINKDLLRTMLHFDKWSGPREGLTRDVARMIAKHFLSIGVNVIIDDTNLNKATVQGWRDLAKELDASIEYIKMDTSMEECIKRDRVRDKKVGKHVIVNMALQNAIYKAPFQGFVLCDLDGTLADIKHRLHFVRDLPEGQKKDWKGFFAGIKDDTPRVEVMDAILMYEQLGHEIIFVSARPEDYREATEAWIEKAFKGYDIGKTLIMRRSGDKRLDTEVKQDIYDIYFKDKYKVAFVLDDRPSVIKMWRDNGLEVIDVGEGIDF